MKSIKISSVWINPELVKNSLLYKIFNKLSKHNVQYVKPNECDILFLGPYNINSIKNRFLKYIDRKFKKKFTSIIEDFNQSIFIRKSQPLKIFYSHENYRYDDVTADYYFTSDLISSKKNHFRFPIWKEYLDWSFLGIARSINKFNHSVRTGEYYDKDRLKKPLGVSFLKKKREISFITSDLKDPKREFYEILSNNFKVHGYGAAFDEKLINHSNQKFLKKDILKNYAFNLCPHNSIYPGYYDERVIDAFYYDTLPITWSDKNISIDFNANALVNLNDYVNNYDQLVDDLKNEDFLLQKVSEPLILKDQNLNKEFEIVEKILKDFN